MHGLAAVPATKDLYSYGLYSYGSATKDLYSYGLYSYGPATKDLYSHGLYSYGPATKDVRHMRVAPPTNMP